MSKNRRNNYIQSSMPQQNPQKPTVMTPIQSLPNEIHQIQYQADVKRVNNDSGFLNVLDFLPTGTSYSPLSSQDQLINSNAYALLTLNRTLLSYAYNTYGVLQTAIDQPVDDAFRGGLKIKSDELNSDDIEELQRFMETRINEKGQNVWDVLRSALKWQRLFGGAGIIINTDQTPTDELKIEWIGRDTPLSFISADRWEMLYSWSLADDIACPYNYYGQPIHKTRILKFSGKEAPSFIRRQLQGWGLSEVERMLRSVNAYIKNQNLIYELLDEAKIDIYKIQGYNASLLTGDSARMVKAQIDITNSQKNYMNAVTMDKEDEYDQKQITFSGLAEILQQNRIGIAADLKMPLAKLFGLSASGFSSGEDDIENYNSMVETEIRSKSKGHIIKLIEICCQKLFGFIPNLEIEFESLRIMNEEQAETIKSSKQDRYLHLYDRGLLTEEEFGDALKTDKIINIKSDILAGKREPELPEYIKDMDQSIAQVRVQGTS